MKMPNSTALAVLLLVAPAFPAAAQSNSGPLPVSSQMKVEQAARDAGAGPASARSLAQAVAVRVPQTRLTASGAQLNDNVGYSVSLSGNLALVGAPQPLNNGPGAAYVFVFDGTTWTQEAKLTAADAVSGDNFGRSVSLSGERALIGAWAKNSAAGVAYVFELDGATWTQTAELTADDSEPSTYFGLSVSLSGDRALIGAYGNSAAYVFDFDGSSWIQTAKLTAGDGIGSDAFGLSVSLSGDRALVGAYARTHNAGAAYVFAFDGTTWNQEGELIPSDTQRDARFGNSVSISGRRALVGAQGDRISGKQIGSAYIFAFDGNTWSQEAQLVPSDGNPYDNFGLAVSISGKRAVVTAGEGVAASGVGVGYLFVLSSSGWSERKALTPSDGLGYAFGASVYLSGPRVIVGAPGSGSGAAYVFGR
jgi:hypothetical protein